MKNNSSKELISDISEQSPDSKSLLKEIKKKTAKYYRSKKESVVNKKTFATKQKEIILNSDKKENKSSFVNEPIEANGNFKSAEFINKNNMNKEKRESSDNGIQTTKFDNDLYDYQQIKD